MWQYCFFCQQTVVPSRIKDWQNVFRAYTCIAREYAGSCRGGLRSLRLISESPELVSVKPRRVYT